MKRDVLEKKVAQLLFVGVSGKQLKKEEKEFLSQVAPGGVILFAHNYDSVPQLVDLTNQIQAQVQPKSHAQIPAWIGVDHEGGRVQRFKAPFTVFPPLKKWGELNSPKTSFEAGYVMAKELRSCGVNLNFAPVLDVLQPKTSNAIGDRSFSEQIDVVSTNASAAVRGLMKGGVFAVAKHFPGHGSVEVDSHVDLPVCNKSVEELEALDWVPFRRAFRSRCEGVMTAHILYPKIDPDRPATLSRRILQEHLRKGLRYSKLVFSDDLEMGALQKRYSLKDAAFLAVEAGCDQLLLCHKYDEFKEVFDHLVSAFESGALAMKKLEESLERVLAAKASMLLPYADADRALAESMVGAPDFCAIADAIRSEKAIEAGPSSRDPSAE